ncbi:MAG: sulfatase [Gemmataceae bacterium]|nr:sulfatase [Gemmataceae bacterium]
MTMKPIQVSLAALALSVGLCGGASAAEQLNLVFLLADDLRWNALGYAGDRIVRTPHLDALAARGVQFRNHFVTTSICAVSRASIFSGQYARRHRIHDFATPFTPAAFARTYPALLRAAGYRTGFIGKYGVGNVMPVKEFDYWRGFPGQSRYFEKGDGEHLTKKMGDQAQEFLAACDGTRPFCLSISFKAPHAQDNAPREYPPDPRDEQLYADAQFPVPTTADEKFFRALPDFVQKSEGHRRWQRRFATSPMYQRTTRDYYRLITGIDREVGRLVAALRERQLDGNTLILFTSDNGYFLGERGLADKWFMYEESIRVPLVIYHPGLPEQQRGRTVEAMTLNIDLAPTLLDFAGVAVPAAMQGRSLRPWLRGERPAWRTEWFYEHHTFPEIIPPSEGVRTARSKYLRWVGVEPAVEELYDLQADPREEQNLAGRAEHGKMLAELRGRWAELRKELP